MVPEKRVDRVVQEWVSLLFDSLRFRDLLSDKKDFSTRFF